MDDAQLVSRAAAGDRDAFGALVDRHRAGVVRVCLRVTRNLPDAEDLAHDAFVDAYLKLAELRDPGSFAAWLRAIALNLCRMWYRRSCRDAARELALEPAPVEVGRRREVRAGLARLSPTHRLTVVLHYWEGLSYEEVARFLDVPIGTVMSRLHRAKRELKRIADTSNNGVESEDEVMVSEEEFRREVEAELAALTRLFGGDRAAMERLSVLLRRSPERFAALLAEADSPTLRADLARLLRRLGAPGVEATVGCALSRDDALRERAVAVLREAVSVPRRQEKGEAEPRLAPRTAYLLLDTLAASSVPEEDRAGLAIDLLRDETGERTALLLLSALACWPEASLARLLAWYRSCNRPEDLHRFGDLLQALCRFGTRFGEELARGIETGERVAVAVAGAEALARSLSCDWLDADVEPDERLVDEARFRRKWSPPRKRYRDRAVIGRLAAALAGLLDTDAAELRNGAIRALGVLRAEEYRVAIRARIGHTDESTSVAAIRALADLGDREAAEAMAGLALEGGRPTERRAAVEALGPLRAAGQGWLLAGLLDDRDAQVRRAAAVALGEIGGEEAQAALRGALRSADRSLVKAASSALFGGVRKPPALASEPPAFRMSDQVRGDARPTFFISMEAALRELPSDDPLGEKELTGIIARACIDYSTTRRYLIEDGLMTRQSGIYELTDLGRLVWRVERWLKQ